MSLPIQSFDADIRSKHLALNTSMLHRVSSNQTTRSSERPYHAKPLHERDVSSGAPVAMLLPLVSTAPVCSGSSVSARSTQPVHSVSPMPCTPYAASAQSCIARKDSSLKQTRASDTSSTSAVGLDQDNLPVDFSRRLVLSGVSLAYAYVSLAFVVLTALGLCANQGSVGVLYVTLFTVPMLLPLLCVHAITVYLDQQMVQFGAACCFFFLFLPVYLPIVASHYVNDNVFSHSDARASHITYMFSFLCILSLVIFYGLGVVREVALSGSWRSILLVPLTMFPIVLYSVYWVSTLLYETDRQNNTQTYTFPWNIAFVAGIVVAFAIATYCCITSSRRVSFAFNVYKVNSADTCTTNHT